MAIFLAMLQQRSIEKKKCALLFFKCKPHLHQVQAAFLKKQGAFFKVLFEIEVLDMLFYKLCMSLSFL